MTTKKFTLLLTMFLAVAGGAKADVEWTVWEGEFTKKNVSLEPVNFTNIEAGDRICVYGTGSLSKGLRKQTGDKWTWGDISGYTATETGTDANYYYTVDADLVTLLSSEDLKSFIIGNWDEGTITKISIKKKSSMIKTLLADESKTTSTFEYTIPSSSLANMVAGDYVYIPATQQSKEESELYKLEFKNVSDWSYYTTIYNYNHDMWWSVPEDTENTVKNNILYIYGEHYNPTGVYLLHPVSSFSIGSIGYATFSASQEVTAPNSVTAYKGTISGDQLVLTPFTNNVIPANTGAIIAGDEGAVLEFMASSESTSETSDLIACTEATNVTSLDSGYDYYILYNNPTGGNTALSLTDLNCGWNSSYNSSTHTITFDGEWKGRGWGWNFDYSDYSKVVVEFESAPKSGALKVQYNDDKDNPTTETADYSEGATFVEINLNASLKNNISQIYLSASSASTLILTNAYLVSNAGSQKAEFRKTTSGTLAANKAYLKIANGGGARTLSIVFDDDDETDIETVAAGKMKGLDDNVYYNLSGMRVSRPKAGLYIVNGKKVVKK